ncbi:MAG: hypothetical protein AB7H77_08060, partial [Bdellovibrionales bacterium]
MRFWLVLFALILGITAGTCRSAAAAEEIIPRVIIALYEGGEIQNSFAHTVAEMPLNHLGLTVEYHDYHQPLPDLTKRKDVRGVITWFYGDTYDDAETYLKWALDTVNAGKKFVIVGSLGVPDDAKHYTISALAARFLAKIGVKMPGRWTGQPFDVTYEYLTPSMFLTQSPYDWIRPSYETMQLYGSQAQAHLIAHRVNGGPADDSALIVTGPNGGYLDADYAIRTSKRGDSDITQWLINPFEFFRLAYGTDDLPKPDPTTLGGRRIYYSNIDGDGWNNVTQLEEYRGKNILSAQVIYEKAIKPYPDLPVMVAPIAGDVDPEWAGSETSRKIARDLFALPQVEAGTHTYSHPFYWDFFENGDVKTEIPYLRLYKTPTWQPEGGLAELKGKTAGLPTEFTVPRAYAFEPFDLHKEIGGSVKFMNSLLPKGKKIEILAWSGDCMPWEEPIRLARETKLQNINGGDTRFDPEYPAYASVAPFGRQVGKQLQIYNSTSNENTYTDLWMDNFHAFKYLRKTVDNTETPMRLSAFSIYYHMYSGEKESALAALLGNLNYARTLNIAPITTGKYTRIAEGFYDTQIVSLGPNAWRVEKRGDLQTLRFDKSSLKAVDLQRSKGVIGQRRHQGSLYVHLDEDVQQPVVVLRDDARYYIQPDDSAPYLIESRWAVSGMQRGAGRFAFDADGYGDGEMTWHVPSAGFY